MTLSGLFRLNGFALVLAAVVFAVAEVISFSIFARGGLRPGRGRQEQDLLPAVLPHPVRRHTLARGIGRVLPRAVGSDGEAGASRFSAVRNLLARPHGGLRHPPRLQRPLAPTGPTPPRTPFRDRFATPNHRCVTRGDSTTRFRRSSMGPEPRLSNRRVPAPSSIGATWIRIWSMRSASRNRRETSALMSLTHPSPASSLARPSASARPSRTRTSRSPRRARPSPSRG